MAGPLFVGGLFLAAAGIGGGILPATLFRGRGERIVVGAVLGLGILSHALFLLGSTVGFTPVPLLGFALAAGVAAVPFWIRRPEPIPPLTTGGEPPTGRGTVAVLLAAAAFALAGVLSPNPGTDALAYHLSIPERFLVEGGVVVFESLQATLWPMGLEILLVPALAWGGVSAAKWTGLLFGILCVAAVHRAGLRFADRGTARWGMLALATVPLFSQQMAHVKNDVATTVYTFLALYAWLAGREERPVAWSALAGLFGGFAASVKYTGLVGSTALGLLVLVDAVRRRRAGPLAAFAAGLFLAGIPYYLRNAVLTGNPVFPFAHEIFGAGWATDLRETVGGEASPWGILLAPWRMTFRPDAFGGGHPGLLFLALLPLSIVAASGRPGARGTGGFLAAFFLLWFFVCQRLRFFIPALPALALLTATGIETWLRREGGGMRERAARAVVWGMLLVQLGIGGWVRRAEVARLLTRESDADFLARRERSWTAASLVRRGTPLAARVLVVAEPAVFFLDRDYRVEYLLHRNGRYDALPPDREGARRLLEEEGITHVLLREGPGQANEDPAGSPARRWLLRREELVSWMGEPLDAGVTDPEGIRWRYLLFEVPAR